MTAKQAVYVAVCNGNVDLASLREEHRSIQVRKVGKDIIQIRFRDSESWMTLEDFASNYRNKILKDLSDRLTSASKVLSQEELLNGLTDECRHILFQAAVDAVLSQKYAVEAEKYNQLVDEFHRLDEAKKSADLHAVQLTTELIDSEEKLEVAEKHISQLKHQILARNEALQQMKKEILDSATMGMVKCTVVEQKLSDYSV